MRTKQNQKGTIDNQTYSKNLLKYNNKKYKNTNKQYQEVPIFSKKYLQEPKSAKKILKVQKKVKSKKQQKTSQNCKPALESQF